MADRVSAPRESEAGAMTASGLPRVPPRLLREGAILIAFGLLAMAESGLWSDLGTRMYSGADPIADVWSLNWVSAHLLSGRIFEGNNNYPCHGAVLFSDILLGPAVLVAPLRAFTSNPILLYNLAVLLSLTLGGYASFRLALSLWGDYAGAAFAGVFVPYNTLQIGHLIHLNILAIAGFPLVVLGLLRLADRPSWLVAIGTGVALGLQAGTSGYYAFAAAILCLVAALWTLPSWWRNPRAWCCWAIAAGVAGIILAPYVLGFRALSAEEGGLTRDLRAAHHYSVGVPSWFLRSRSYVWSLVFGYTNWESLWPGAVSIVLAAVGLRGAWDRRLRLFMVVGIVFFVLALGPDVQVFHWMIAPLPFRLLFDHVPFASAIRHPVTFMLPVFLMIALVAARGASLLRLGGRPVAGTAVVLAALVETLAPIPGRTPMSTQLPDVYRELLRLPRGALLDLPFSYDADSQWWSIFHGLPTVNGQLPFEPAAYGKLESLVTKEWSRERTEDLEDTTSLAFLKSRYPIRYVVVHPEAPKQMRLNVAATSGSLSLIHESAGGARIYLLKNGGRASTLRRFFREDQLVKPLQARLEGPRGSMLSVSMNGTLLEKRALTGARETVSWSIPPQTIRWGMNLLTLGVEPGELTLEQINAGQELVAGP